MPPAAALVLTEATKENVFHATKDTSGAGRGDQPRGLPSSPTTQACFEEPQPSTSTSDLFPTAFASSMEPPAGRAPPSGSGERGILGGGSDRFCSPILADVVLRQMQPRRSSEGPAGTRLSVVRFLGKKYSCSRPRRNAEGQSRWCRGALCSSVGIGSTSPGNY